MKTTQYTVISEAGANLRLYPSGSYPTKEPVGTMRFLADVQVISDWTAVNTVGSKTCYLPVMNSGAVRYVSSALLGRLSCGERAAMAAPYVYQKIYDLKALHKGASGVVNMETLEEQKRISCGRAASIVLQLAGVLPVGKVISHTDADGKGGTTKSTVHKAVTGYQHLIPGTYTMERMNCVFEKLPEQYKKAGVVYIQDSNVCVSAGSGKIYSCNQSGKRYGDGGEAVLRSGGYPFKAKILYVIAPDHTLGS